MTLAEQYISRRQQPGSLVLRDRFEQHQEQVERWYEWVVRSLQRQHLSLPNKLSVGVITKSTMGAMVTPVFDDGSYAITIDEGMFLFMEVSSDWIADYFPLSDLDNIIISEYTKSVFTSLLLGRIGVSDDHWKATPTRSEEQKEFARRALELASFAVVAHEYAHAALGHNVPSNTESDLNLTGDDDNPLKQEILADQHSLITTLDYADQHGYNLALAYWAADFLFGAYAFLEKFDNEVAARAIDVLSKNRGSYKERQTLNVTHPPTAFRRQMLRQLMQGLQEDEQFERTVIGIGLKQGRLSEDFLVKLWYDSRKDFQSRLFGALSKK